MTNWTGDEVARVGGADEPKLTALRTEGGARRPVTISTVHLDEGLYVRSWRGASGSRHSRVQARPEGHISAGSVERDVEFLPAEAQIGDAIHDAYRTKCSRYPSYVKRMVSAGDRATTLKILPRAEALR
jgi:hypothetical protein